MEAQILHLEGKIDIFIAGIVKQEVENLALATTLRAVSQHRQVGGQDSALLEVKPADRINLFWSLGGEFVESRCGNASGLVAKATPDTMWDAALLAGLSAVRPMGTCIILISLFSSVCLQAGILHVFTWAAGRNWQQVPISAEPPRFDGIIAGVVNILFTNNGRELATEQSTDAFPWAMHVKTDLAKLVMASIIIFWIFLVACEFKRTLGTAVILWLLPRCTSRIARCDDRFIFVSISSSRLFFVVTITVVRTCVAWAVLTHGAICLVRAKSSTDLALSFGALGVVLDVPKFVWSWGCNGGRWSSLLALEVRTSFMDSLIESWRASSANGSSGDDAEEVVKQPCSSPRSDHDQKCHVSKLE
eukprot:TRINITY_DN58005_c0_g1_i1.p1 TRINITY_DN58005_c0_g1~~TRINITY_DN58005_c0_g1_i1.p1  ORF type:complete len:380 (+),score=61.03 TRINITY_DN58005_c0_g1_i1:59-1141(+)